MNPPQLSHSPAQAAPAPPVADLFTLGHSAISHNAFMASVLFGFVIVCLIFAVCVVASLTLLVSGLWRRSTALKIAAIFPIGFGALIFVPTLLLVIAWMVSGEGEDSPQPIQSASEP